MWSLSWPEFNIITRTKEIMLNPDKAKKQPSKKELEDGMDKTMRKAKEAWEKKNGRKFGEK